MNLKAVKLQNLHHEKMTILVKFKNQKGKCSSLDICSMQYIYLLRRGRYVSTIIIEKINNDNGRKYENTPYIPPIMYKKKLRKTSCFLYTTHINDKIFKKKNTELSQNFSVFMWV